MAQQKTSRSSRATRVARVVGELLDAVLLFGGLIGGTAVLVGVVWLVRVALQLIGVVPA